MTAAGDGPWLDDAAGRLVRPFTVSNGRTRPTVALDLMSQVMATGATPLGCGALTTKPPEFHHNPTDRALLEAVLDGLRRQL